MLTRTRGIALASFALYVGVMLIGSGFALANGEAAINGQSNSFVAYLALPFAVVGPVVLWRRGNPFGWVMTAMALSFAAWFAARQYAVYTLLVAPGSLPGGPLALQSTTAWADLGWAIAFTLLPLLFPNGTVPSRRWRPAVWLGATLVAVNVTQGQLFQLPTYPPVPPGSYTFGLAANDAAIAALIVPVVVLVYLPIGALCLAAPRARFRRAGPVERQQLKWFVFAVALLPMELFLDALSRASGHPSAQIFTGRDLVSRIDGALVIASFLGFQLAIAFAILRYRLYDIDVIINRTLVYGATSVAIAVTFFGGIVAVQAVLRPLTSGSELAVAIATLVSFGLFQPIRGRVQAAVDRRFDRTRYDAARTLEAFADRLRDEVDLGALRVELLGAVGGTMAPAHVSLWLRERAR